MGYDAMDAAPHHVVLEERRSLTVSGVEDVERFDETTIVLSTARGSMVVSGSQLRIEKLALDGGELKVEGEIDAISYDEGPGEGRGGLLARLLR